MGANNINLFEPKGQFGTRLQGGKDSASERYIFTNLNPLTRYIYPSLDDNVLKYLDDDGTPVEPVYYAPIIPMILINGSKGIGTGFSSDILPYNPLSIIDYVIATIQNKEKPQVLPYFQGFKGIITPINSSKYLIKGKYDIISDNQVRVYELPVGTWTDDYKQTLENLIQDDGKKTGKKKSIITDYTDMSTDCSVDITITFSPGFIQKMIQTETEYGCCELEKFLKLYTTKTSTNMHMFDETEKLKKFDNVEDIIDYYINIRRNIYKLRKDYLLKALKTELLVLTNKARFITDILNDKIILKRKKKEEVINMLNHAKYDCIDDDNEFKYLTKLPMDSVTEENVEKNSKR